MEAKVTELIQQLNCTPVAIVYVYMTEKEATCLFEKKKELHLNSKLYDKYSEYCKKEGIVLSRQIEKFIMMELNKNV